MAVEVGGIRAMLGEPGRPVPGPAAELHRGQLDEGVVAPAGSRRPVDALTEVPGLMASPAWACTQLQRVFKLVSSVR